MESAKSVFVRLGYNRAKILNYLKFENFKKLNRRTLSAAYRQGVAGLVGKIGRDFVTFAPIQTCATTETTDWGLYSNVIVNSQLDFLLITNSNFAARKTSPFFVILVNDPSRFFHLFSRGEIWQTFYRFLSEVLDSSLTNLQR